MDYAVAQQQQLMLERAGPDNVVYDFAYDKPERHATPEQAVKLAHFALIERQKLKGVPDIIARETLLKEHKLLEVFSRTHPSGFNMVTEASKGAEHFAVFAQMARLRHAADESGASEAEATARANEILQARCARGIAKE